MTKSLHFIIAQLNFIVGDIKGNTRQIIDASKRAKEEYNADLLILPELALCGYPPEDLLIRADFHQQINEYIEYLLQRISDIDIILGYPWQDQGKIYNTAMLIEDRKITFRYAKNHLPNYGVFDEKRYFTPGQDMGFVNYHGIKLALCVCEDLWNADYQHRLAQANIDLIISLNASPFNINKVEHRQHIVKQCALKSRAGVIYVHCVGGQDEVVFDGGSFVMNAQGEVCIQGTFFKSELIPVEINTSPIVSIPKQKCICTTSHHEHIYQALVLGTQDYTVKNGFKGALIGLSGGIDSALTLCIAVDALGAKNVTAVMMPSQYTSAMSMEDAELLAKNLGVHYQVISIESMFSTILHTLQPVFADTKTDTTEENIQARCRGLLLMALSNKFGHLVLTTGNKSEMAVGYATLYGDMAGGFAVLKDVEKTLVYELTHYRNTLENIVPQRIIKRAPSAELAHGQVDQDSLPPYDILDKILQRYVEQDQSFMQIVDAGFDGDTVKKVLQMVDRNEYKRRQAPPGIRITTRAFGRDRRYPITSKYYSLD